MLFSANPFAALLLSSAGGALAAPRSVAVTSLAAVAAADKPAAFFLAGDSTTAVQAASGGGWGNGFLETTLQNGATGKNYGHNGATTVSFREGGDWDTVLQEVKDAVAEYTPYVTIQFGHNDQKSDKGISIDEYTANLEQFVEDVRDAGGKPILVTPLSRRQYSSSNSSITENLAAQRAATLAAAASTSALSIDLNRASTDYLNAIGADAAYTYNLDSDDRTHLNAAGSVVFGNMVSWLMDQIEGEEGEALKQWTVPGDAYVSAFEEGVYIAE